MPGAPREISVKRSLPSLIGGIFSAIVAFVLWLLLFGTASIPMIALGGLRACSTSLQTRLIVSRSGPKTLTPMVVRTPVESMSMRLAIGCVQMLLQPGTWMAVSIS